MDIKKTLFGGLIVAGGSAFLACLMVLFCFTEIQIPTLVYVTAWIGCLYVMMRAAAKIYR